MSKSTNVMPAGAAGKTVLGTVRSTVGHREAAQRITQQASNVTTKQGAQALLRSAGIFTSRNKLVKALG
jgi:hypothetical protein